MNNILSDKDQVSFLIECGLFLIVYIIYSVGVRGLDFTNIIMTFLVFSSWLLIIILIKNFNNSINFPLPTTSRSSYNF
jgi:amino acid transporter